MSLGVSAAAAASGAFVLRRGRIGFVDTGGRYWWADQRNAWVNFAAWAWPIPAFLVAYAAMVPTPAAWEVVDAGSALRATRIERVLDTEYVSGQRASHYYKSVVKVPVPFDGGTQVRELGLISGAKPSTGEEVLVLFAPSSPELSAFIGDRQSLEELVGGRADFWTVALTLLCVVASFFLALFGRWRSDPVLGLHRVREHGRLHVLPVTVTGVSVAIDERPNSSSGTRHLKPRVRLFNTDLGELYLFLDESIDPVPLAGSLTGGRGHVYWRRAAAKRPHAGSVGQGVLELGGERYVAGWLATAEDSVELPATNLVPSDWELPAVGSLRAVHPASRVEVSANLVVVRSILVAVLPLMVIAFGVGDAATVGLAAASVLIVLRGRRRAHRLLRQHLAGLTPGMDLAGTGSP